MSLAFVIVCAGIQGGLALQASRRGEIIVAGACFAGCVFSLCIAILMASHRATVSFHP